MKSAAPSHRRSALRQLGGALLLGSGWLGAAAFRIQEQDRSGWLPHQIESSDPTWPTLAAASLDYDPAKGVLRASFSEGVRQLNGRPFSISGFYMPLDARPASGHFLLTRRNTSCPFCPGNEPTEAIEVFALQPVAFTKEPLVASGRFEVVSESADGLFYRLHEARVSLQ